MKKWILTALCLPLLAIAEENPLAITIKDHKFEPAEIVVPAGKKVRLLIENKDSTPEEFESYQLNREKIVAGNSSTVIYIGPLDEGRYPFFGEFNQATAKGTIVVK